MNVDRLFWVQQVYSLHSENNISCAFKHLIEKKWLCVV